MSIAFFVTLHHRYIQERTPIHWSTAVIGWIPRLLFQLVVRTQTPTFGSLVWWQGRKPNATGRCNGFLSCGLCPATPLFVTVSHQTGLATRSITRRSIIRGWCRGPLGLESVFVILCSSQVKIKQRINNLRNLTFLKVLHQTLSVHFLWPALIHNVTHKHILYEVI